jgi:hypothetical protein
MSAEKENNKQKRERRNVPKATCKEPTERDRGYLRNVRLKKKQKRKTE